LGKEAGGMEEIGWELPKVAGLNRTFIETAVPRRDGVEHPLIRS
jgi:hypothetical protein